MYVHALQDDDSAEEEACAIYVIEHATAFLFFMHGDLCLSGQDLDLASATPCTAKTEQSTQADPRKLLMN